MKFQKIVFIFAVACFTLASCKNANAQKETATTEVTTGTQKVSFAISGMTCEIGCAKTIQSKLSKKEGITNATVVFKDKLATVEYNDATISKEEILDFVNSIAGGKTYTTKEVAAHKACATDCKKACCAKKISCKKGDKKGCDAKKAHCSKADKKCDGKDKAACKKACDAKKESCKKGDKKACDAKKAHCSKADKKCDGKDKAACKKACDAKKATPHKDCKKDCKKACCAKKA